MDWSPTLKDRSGPVYLAVVEALAADIASGRLQRGQQLPTHRALAKALGVDLTTVTRAYTEARRRGLTEARVGQGTFVAETISLPRGVAAPRPSFDLTMNLPPQPLDADLEGRIVRGIAALQRETGFASYLNYRDAGGSADERAVAAEWLRQRLPDLDGERLLICPGTQNALLSLLLTLVAPGDVIVTEELTYPGIKAVAAATGVRLIGVPTDGAGILPDALAMACKQSRPKAVYLVPTMHNPTTVTMPPARRREVVAVLRAHDMPLIEDDAYGALAPTVVPMAVLMPERTYLAASLSKCIAPGLRVSLLVTPDRRAAAPLAQTVRATTQMSSGLMVALVTRWLRDGSADAVIAAISEEARARQKLAAQTLAGLTYAAHPAGHHIWVPLPKFWSTAEFATHVHREGLAVVTSEAFAVGHNPPDAVRVALGAAASRAELVRALDVLAGALRDMPATARVV